MGRGAVTGASDPVRDRIEALAAAQGASLATLSKVVGRNPAYIQQYLRRGTPRVLPERERGVLARFLGVDERELGAVAPFIPGHGAARLKPPGRSA